FIQSGQSGQAFMEHPIGANLEAQKAFWQRAYSHTVGVVNLRLEKIGIRNGQQIYGEEVGTGSAVRWRERDLILTAGHIANDAGISELEFFLRASGTINWDSEARATDVSHRVALEIEQIALCTSEDLAAIVLRPNAARVDFLTLNEDTFSSPPVGANVLLFGHPADGTFEVARIQVGPGIQNMIMACRPAAFIGAIVQAPERPLSGFDAREHLLVEFE